MSEDPLWTREQHVLDLALHRWISGDLDVEERAAVDAHLVTCARCAERLAREEARGGEALPELPFALPTADESERRTTLDNVITFPGRSGSTSPAATTWPEEVKVAHLVDAQVAAQADPDSAMPTASDAAQAEAAAQSTWSDRRSYRRWAGAASVLALAAAALLVVRTAAPTGPGPDVLRARGGEVALEVYRDAQGAASERLSTGDAVRAGDVLGFRVRARRAGHLLVLNVDGAGAVSQVFPRAEERSSAPIEGAATPQPLDRSFELDATPGEERLVALLCEAPLDWARAEGAAREATRAPGQDLAALVDGCAQAEVRVEKETP